MIHIDGTDLIAQLDAHGWAQGDWTAEDGAICDDDRLRWAAQVDAALTYLTAMVEP